MEEATHWPCAGSYVEQIATHCKVSAMATAMVAGSIAISQATTNSPLLRGAAITPSAGLVAYSNDVEQPVGWNRQVRVSTPST